MGLIFFGKIWYKNGSIFQFSNKHTYRYNTCVPFLLLKTATQDLKLGTQAITE